jgi:hypothetical protein
MAAPASVKKLAAELVAQGVESAYMARVLARVEPEQRIELLEQEIAQEVAQALGRTEDRLNLALAELELHHARHARAVLEGLPESERLAHAAAHEAARKVAQSRLQALLIQREAIGFRRNQLLYELYPIPPKLER